MTSQNYQKRVKIWLQMSIFGVIYQPLALKIHPKVGLLSLKTMPEHFLKNSKNWKSQEVDFFEPPKYDEGMGVNMSKSVDFWVKFRSTSSKMIC